MEGMVASLVFANLMGLIGFQIKLETVETYGKIFSLVEFAICVIAFGFMAFMKEGRISRVVWLLSGMAICSTIIL